MVDAQEWLDKNYPSEGTCQRKDWKGNNHQNYGKKRIQITELDIIGKGLTGSLNLIGFNNLTKFDCSGNQLTNPSFLNQLNLTKLVSLEISNNKFTSDLVVFNSFINLESLSINTNNWTGSLQPLQTLSKLNYLAIESTNLTTGLEYLPDNLKVFCCSLTELAKELEVYGKPNINHDNYNYIYLLHAWRKDNQFFIAKVQLLVDRDRQIAFLTIELATKQEELTTANTNHQSEVKQLKQAKEELEEKLTILQTKYEELLEQANNRQKILKEIGEKRKELEVLINNCAFNKDQEFIVREVLLEAQKDIILYNTASDEERKEKVIKHLVSKFTTERINNLCLLQSEITSLDKALDQARNQAEIIIEDLMKLTKGQFMIKNRQQNLILFGDINYSQVGKISIENSQIGGSLLMGVGQAQITELTDQFQAQTLQSPKNPL